MPSWAGAVARVAVPTFGPGLRTRRAIVARRWREMALHDVSPRPRCKVSMTGARGCRAAGGRRPSGGASGSGGGACWALRLAAEAVAQNPTPARHGRRRVVVTGCAAALDRYLETHRDVTVTLAAVGLRRWQSRAGGALSAPGAAQFAARHLKIGTDYRSVQRRDPAGGAPAEAGSAAAGCSEARRRARYPELVLTGVNLGCFRDREAGLDLAGLLEAVAAVDGVERVRLSSIEVNHLSDRLLRAVADTPGVARHLHVPMQSGSDRVLGAMRRHYAAAGFLGKMHRARELVDGINLTSDVIVGHPAERVEDFGPPSMRSARWLHQGARVPVLPAAWYRRRRRRRFAEKRRRSCRLRALRTPRRRPSRLKVGRRAGAREDADGRGYSDDYTRFQTGGGRRPRCGVRRGGRRRSLPCARDPDRTVSPSCATP